MSSLYSFNKNLKIGIYAIVLISLVVIVLASNETNLKSSPELYSLHSANPLLNITLSKNNYAIGESVGMIITPYSSNLGGVFLGF